MKDCQWNIFEKMFNLSFSWHECLVALIWRGWECCFGDVQPLLLWELITNGMFYWILVFLLGSPVLTYFVRVGLSLLLVLSLSCCLKSNNKMLCNSYEMLNTGGSLHNVGLMLVQCLRQWANIRPTQLSPDQHCYIHLFLFICHFLSCIIF